MFTSATTVLPALSTTTFPVSAAPSGRSHRLRGLKHLRNYTHTDDPPPDGNSVQFVIPITVVPTSRSSTPDTSRSGRSSANRTAEPDCYMPNPQRIVTSSAADSSSRGHSTISGWVPTVGNPSGHSRLPARQEGQGVRNVAAGANTRRRAPRRVTTESVVAVPSTEGATMVSRAEGSHRPAGEAAPAPPQTEQPGNTTAGAGSMQQETASAARNTLPDGQAPTIRFVPHQDPRSGRPSLRFPVISRTLPNGNSVIRVGRYSERDSPPVVSSNQPSAAPVGFKSKVVSRRHCEFWCADGQWFIKDVKSSSGTFLNHIRLSQPGAESTPWPVNDGDVVQLGIDFRGGEEMIFRCVKIRVECNRGWQSGPNTFK